MKGMKIEKAKPSNVLDVYAMLKEAHKSGSLIHPKPTDDQVKQYYFTLLENLAQPTTAVYLARKGRMFLGFIDLHLVFRSFGPSPIAFISYLYVIEKKRKLGVGRALIKQAMEDLKQTGISQFEFLCQDELTEYFAKKYGARKILNHMIVGGRDG